MQNLNMIDSERLGIKGIRSVSASILNKILNIPVIEAIVLIVFLGWWI